MKKYLITGCAGFIGSNFVHYMLKKYPEILLVNLDKLTYAGNLENLKDVEGDPRHVFVQGDICDKELVESLFAKYDFDYVINFAAESHVDRSIKNPEIFICEFIDNVCFSDLSRPAYFQGTVTGIILPIQKLIVNDSFQIHNSALLSFDYFYYNKTWRDNIVENSSLYGILKAGRYLCCPFPLHFIRFQYYAIIFKNSCSLRTFTPSCCAFASLLPAFSPQIR